MNKHELCILALRMFALYIFYQAIVLMGLPLVGGVAMFITDSHAGQFLILFTPIVFNLILGAIVWKKADKWAVCLLPGHSEVKEGVDTSIKDIQIVAFTIVGLLILTRVIPNALQEIATYIQYRGKLSVMYFENYVKWLSLLARLVIGLWLLLGARGVVNLIHKIRSAGVQMSAR